MSENPERPEDVTSPNPSAPTQQVSDDLVVPAATPTLELGALDDAAPRTPQAPGAEGEGTAAGPAGEDGRNDDDPSSARARHRALHAQDASERTDSVSVRRRSLFAQAPATPEAAGTTDAAGPASQDGEAPSGPAPTDASAAGGSGATAGQADGHPVSPQAEDAPMRPVWHARSATPQWAASQTPQEAPSAPAGQDGDGPATAGEAGATTVLATSGSAQWTPRYPAGPDSQAPALPGPDLPAPPADHQPGPLTLVGLAPVPGEEPRSEDDILLEGSVVVGRPASRAVAHWLGVLLSLVLLPAAWFLLHDAATHLTQSLEPYRFATSGRALATLAAGCLVLVVALWTARRSSLGTLVTGALTTLVSLPALVVPTLVGDHLTPLLERLDAHSELGRQLAQAVWSDLTSGRALLIGLGLVMVGVVSHSARRAGRREQTVINRGRRSREPVA